MKKRIRRCFAESKLEKSVQSGPAGKHISLCQAGSGVGGVGNKLLAQLKQRIKICIQSAFLQPCLQFLNLKIIKPCKTLDGLLLVRSAGPGL